ncbi:MAG: DUF1643 domain-containing protein [Ferruginibacter sp.]
MLNEGANFSECGLYRYKLWRIWDENLPMAMCTGLNPSTANSEKNDATIRILIRMIEKLNYGGFYMMNCFPFITSSPELLLRDEISDGWNFVVIQNTAAKCKDIIFSWGDFKIIKDAGMDKVFESIFPDAKCFGKSKSGSPLHPLAMSQRNGRDPNNPKLSFYRTGKI